MPLRLLLTRARAAVNGAPRATAALIALLAGTGACGSTDRAAPARPAATRAPDAGVAADAGAPDEAVFTDKHLVFDDEVDGGAAPRAHTEPRWGNYIDKQGQPAVGWHSHDPVTGEVR